MTNILRNLDWIFIITTIAKACFVWGLALFFMALNITLDRKISSFMQDRVGPNRAHILGIRLFGFILNLADGVKLFFKEDITPSFVNKFYYLASPFIIMTIALMGLAVIPIADTLTISNISIPMQVLDLNVGFLFILAITSLSVYSLVLGGFGSNSKFPLFSAMRASAQMISYEIAMGLSLVGLVMVFSTFQLGELTSRQGHLLFGIIPKWGIVVQPLGFVLFCIASLAELNRVPFDLPEGESEIIGFHTEYSAMKYGLFFMAEYANIFVAGCIISTLFLGGWQIPWLPTDTLKANSAVVLQAASALAIIGALFAAFRLHVFYKKRRYKWSDMRDYEGIFLYGALGLTVLAGLGAIIAGYIVPFNDIAAALVALVLQVSIFIFKAFIICFIIVWIRWSLPRLRYDQLMRLGWKIMLPIGIANVLITGVALLLFR